MYELSKAAGWNQTLDDLRTITAANPKGNLAAVLDEPGGPIQVGSGLVTSLGENLAWIGMLLVDVNYRRRGIAMALMESCLINARIHGNHQVVGLDATPAGMKVYQKLGFKASFQYWRCVIPTMNTIDLPADNHSIHTWENSSLVFPEVWGLKQKTTWVDLLRQLNPQGCWVSRSDNQTNGLVMTRPGRRKPFVGPLMADSLTTARALLQHVLDYWKQQGHSEVFMDIPEKHFNLPVTENKGTLNTPGSGPKLHPGANPDRALVRMYQEITEEEYKVITSTMKQGKFEGRKAMDHAMVHRKHTQEFVDKEQKALNYLYATGGPEVG